MRSAWRERGAFLLLAVVIVGCLFRDAVVHGYVLGQGELLQQFQPWRAHAPLGWRPGNPLLGDSPTVFYPFLVHAKNAITRGEFPLWTKDVGAGLPFFAAFQSAVLSPFSLVGYLFPLPQALTLIAAARLIVGGLGMFVFLRALGLGGAAATFGGVAYLLNPFSVVWLEHPLSAVSAWLPWLLLAVERCVASARAVTIAPVALATALVLLSGHPETAFKVMLLAGAYALYRAAWSGHAVRSLTAAAAGVALGALVCAVQIVPFLEYALQSRVLALRSPSSSHLTLPPVTFITGFVPDFFGNPTARRYIGSVNYCEQQIYPGMVTWILAVAALATPRQRGRTVFFLAIAAIAALIIYGTVVTTLAVTLAPPLRVAALGRFGLVVIAGLMIAASLAVDRLLATDQTDVRREWIRMGVAATLAAVAIAVLIALFFFAQHAFLESRGQLSRTTGAVGWALLLVGASVAGVWLLPFMPRRVAAGVFIGLVAVDLFLVADGFHPLKPRETSFPAVPEIELLRQDRDLFRVTGWHDALVPNTALVYGFQDFRAYDGVGIRQYSDLLDVAFHYNGSTHRLVNFAAPQVLDLLNVKYVLVPNDVDAPSDRFAMVQEGPVRIFRNKSVMPRVFLADAYVTLKGDEARRALRGGAIDLRRTVILEEEPAAPPLASTSGLAADAVVVRQYGDHRVTIEATSSGARLLVLSDVFYPGWTATIDGVPTPILRANFAFRAISLPEGTHIVEFRYRPRSFAYGLAGSGMGVILLAITARRRGYRQEG